MITVRPIVSSDSLSLATLHIENLRTPFHGKPGVHLLALYYQALASSTGGCGFIAEEEGRPLGYVCGVWDPRSIRSSLIKRHAVPLAMWGLFQVVIRPSMLASLLGIFQKTTPPTPHYEGYELRPIVVAPAARGSGLAPTLVDHLIADARQRGFAEIYLFTEEDNLPSNRFYQRYGFCLANTEQRKSGLYHRYTIGTSK